MTNNTSSPSEIWWQHITGIERVELMKKYSVKKYSRKAVQRMYKAEFKQL